MKLQIADRGEDRALFCCLLVLGGIETGYRFLPDREGRYIHYDKSYDTYDIIASVLSSDQ